MNSYAGKPMIYRACAICGQRFGSVSPHAEYCTLKCQSVAKRLRRKHREAVTRNHAPDDSRFFTTITNPTVAHLDLYADLIKQDKTQGKPISFVGEIPEWKVPAGIELTKGQKLSQYETDVWLMQKKEVDIMEVFKSL